MKRLFVILAAMLVIASVQAQYIDSPSTLTKEQRKMVAKSNDFAVRLFQQARSGENMVMSPLSVSFALGLANNGAAGDTRQQISSVLGFGDTDISEINALYRKLLTEATAFDPNTKVNLANTLFLNQARGLKLKTAFVNTARQYFDAEPQLLDFGDGQTLDAINQWASEKTAGLVPRLLSAEEFNPDYVSYLLNALSFQGSWTYKFKPEDTHTEPFDGGKSTVQMMSQRLDRIHNNTDNGVYRLLTLPYGNSTYAMTILLPDEGKTLDDVLESMRGLDIYETIAGSSVCDLLIKIPRFETSTELELNSVLSSLGMESAFDIAQADFPDFCYDGDDESNSHPVSIEKMKQATRIQVDEEGSTAASTTTIPKVDDEPLYVEFIANRPFIYTITCVPTGAIFFIGQYVGENTTSVAPVRTSERRGDGTVYTLSGQRLQTEPEKGVYIKDGRKWVKK